MSDKPLLSICIPTYNRADVVTKTVKDILNYKGNEIEVVVTDNASTDDTLKKLNELKDPRLKIFSNEKNIGFEKNVLKSLENSTTEYSFYINDREIVYVEKIPKLLKEISDKKYDLILTSVLKIDKQTRGFTNAIKNFIKLIIYRKNFRYSYIYYKKNFYSKLETIKKIFERGHPTGIIVRNNVIDFEFVYNNYSYGVMYPHIFLMLVASIENKIYFSKNFYSATLSNPYNSHTIKESKNRDKVSYFHPRSRFFQMQEKMKWLNILDLRENEKKKLYIFLFSSFLKLIKNKNNKVMLKKIKSLKSSEDVYNYILRKSKEILIKIEEGSK